MTNLKSMLSEHVAQHTPTTAPPYAQVTARARRRTARRRLVVSAAVSGVAAVTVASLAMLPQSDRDPVAGRPSTSPNGSTAAYPSPGGSGAVEFAGTFSCVESYRPALLPNRGFAFDGTITSIGQAPQDGEQVDLDLQDVTFAVHSWYAGGDVPTVTVAMYKPGVTSSENVAAYAVGTRLLVSGEPRWGGEALDSPIAWGCGFTRYYDEHTAEQWAIATR